MSEAIATRPQRIASIKEAMAELGRARLSMRAALRDSNDERHQDFFAPVLDRLGLIIANELDGITLTLADDLANARSALRRLRLPDIDPELEQPTPALLALRSERGNLIEAIDNALDAAAALRLHPRLSELGGIRIERREIAEQLIRLDERLRAIEEGVIGLREAAVQADAAPGADRPSQAGLVNIHVRTLQVEVSAARFETGIDRGAAAAEDSDLTALSRSVEAIREIAGDLRQAVAALAEFMTEGVRVAGGIVVRAAERSWRGWRAVVRTVRRRLTRDAATPRPQPEEVAAEPPADFDIRATLAPVSHGELKRVSILFCDLVDSTGLTERLGAEAMHELIHWFLDTALAEVQRYGGTAPQFTGDGFMALFGALVAHEDHVRRALLAALGIQGAVGGRGLQAAGRPRHELPMRIGVHTGLVVFGSVGGNLRMDPTAIGDVANVAARLQAAAEPGTILISEETYRLAQGYARAEPVGVLNLGKSAPVAGYRLLGVSHRALR